MQLPETVVSLHVKENLFLGLGLVVTEIKKV